MTSKQKIELALSNGKIEGAKKLIVSSLKQEHKQKWREKKKEEYLKLFPKYRPMTEEEYYASIKNLDPTEIVLWGDLENIPNVKKDYSNNPSFKEFNVWVEEEEYIALTELEIERKISEFFSKNYVSLRLKTYPSLGELPDALTKDWDSMPQDFKKLFSNLGKYLDKCKKVKKMYPKEVKSA